MQIGTKDVYGVRAISTDDIAGNLGITPGGRFVGLTRVIGENCTVQLQFITRYARSRRWRRVCRYVCLLSLQQIQDVSALQRTASVD